MTHPHFQSALPLFGAQSSAFRSNPARVIENRTTNPLSMQFETAVAVEGCCDMPPTRPPERHPRKIRTDPTDEIAVKFTLI